MRRHSGIHQISEREEDGKRIITYRLIGQIDGRGCFAEVCLQKDTTEDGIHVVFDERTETRESGTIGYNVLKYNNNEEFLQAVAFGIYYALDNHVSENNIAPCVITVLHVGEIIVDTTLDMIAYTAAFATWKLLNIGAINEPYFQDHRIHFPGKKPTIVNNGENN